MGWAPIAAGMMLLLVVATAGCGDDATDAPRDETVDSVDSVESSTTPLTTPTTTMPDRSLPPTRPPERVPSTSLSAPVIGEVPEALLDAILADAADRTGVQPATIVTVRAQAVTWPDGSLDCPEPGVMYTQALVPGYWVELDAEGTLLDYRVVSNDWFVLCEDPALGRP